MARPKKKNSRSLDTVVCIAPEMDFDYPFVNEFVDGATILFLIDKKSRCK